MQYLQIDNIQLEIHNYNDDFILLKNKDIDILPLICQAIFESKFEFVEEVVATQVEIYLKLNTKLSEEILASISKIRWSKGETLDVVTLPIFFDDNPDWEMLTLETKMSKHNYLETLLSSDLSVGMYGFMPGFLYLNGLDKDLQIPRKSTPSKIIAPNSFAVGGPYAGIYSLASPSGWYVIGQLAVPIFNKISIPPLKLKVGQKIKLQSISRDEYHNFTK